MTESFAEPLPPWTAVVTGEGRLKEFMIHLPHPPGILDRNGRSHPQAVNRHEQLFRKRARADITDALNQILGPGARPEWGAYITGLELWLCKGKQHPDADQISARCKPYLDGAQDAGLISNDRYVKPLLADWRKLFPGEEPGVLLLLVPYDPEEVTWLQALTASTLLPRALTLPIEPGSA